MAEIGTIGPYDSMNLPYSPEAEQAVLGALVMEPSCLDSIIEIIPNPAAKPSKPSVKLTAFVVANKTSRMNIP